MEKCYAIWHRRFRRRETSQSRAQQCLAHFVRKQVKNMVQIETLLLPNKNSRSFAVDINVISKKDNYEGKRAKNINENKMKGKLKKPKIRKKIGKKC